MFVIDDSAVARGLWSRLIDAEPDMTVVGTAADGLSGLEALRRLRADIVILDLEMPGMGGEAVLPRILDECPGTQVIVASALTTAGSQAAVSALTLGAAECVAKPTSLSPAAGVRKVAEELLAKIRALRREREPSAAVPAGAKTTETPRSASPAAIVVGASTGGPNALVTLLSGLAPRFPLPILIVQHMPAYFIPALSERIALETRRDCRLALQGERVVPGRIYLAPGDRHLNVISTREGATIRLSDDEPENFCRPAVDPLFRSAAAAYGNRLIAVVLTGMGEDGRAGAEEVTRAGGLVLAQDEASSVVWGMPGAVARAGLASEVLPVEQLAHRLGELVSGGASR